jgi:hypothetical protein
MSCSLVISSEDGRSALFKNVGDDLQNYTESHVRRFKIHSHRTERAGSVSNVPEAYLLGAQLESWARHILYRLRLFVFFLGTSGRSGHDRFISYALQFVNRRIIQCYVVRVTYSPPMERKQGSFQAPTSCTIQVEKHVMILLRLPQLPFVH